MNTYLVIGVLAKAATQKGGPPFMVVLENGKGFVLQKFCRPMLRHLLR